MIHATPEEGGDLRHTRWMIGALSGQKHTLNHRMPQQGAAEGADGARLA